MFRNLFNGTTGIMFLVLFVLNSLLSTVVYSIGLSTGYEGEPSWSWERYGNTMGSLFGDFASLLALIGGLVLFIGAAALAGWFARHQRVTGAIVWFLIGALGGGFILFRVVDWDSFGFGFSPVVALLVFTFVETLIIAFVANRPRR